MNTTTRRAASVIGTVAALTSLSVMSPAQSTTLIPSHVTVHTTDSTPASGQTFRLWGAVWSQGHRVAAVVSVKTFRHGQWIQLPGAVMHTNRDNTYRIRIVLQMKGERMLRVVGNPVKPGIATSQKTITVTVH